MPEITVISGKGGTGKTTVTAAFAHLAGNAVVCDLDVDAPDLHLILQPEREAVADFRAGHVAVIDPARCRGCGVCMDVCRFGAIADDGVGYSVNNPWPARAARPASRCARPVPSIFRTVAAARRRYARGPASGRWIHAQLFPAPKTRACWCRNLRKEARELAIQTGRNIVLSDGAPGIGCPVISSLAGTQLAVLVTEPTPSGRHDLERVC
jgi:MinD superfamily P-loop ATPase